MAQPSDELMECDNILSGPESLNQFLNEIFDKGLQALITGTTGPDGEFDENAFGFNEANQTTPYPGPCQTDPGQLQPHQQQQVDANSLAFARDHATVQPGPVPGVANPENFQPYQQSPIPMTNMVQPPVVSNPASPHAAMASPDSSSANHASPRTNGHDQKCTFQLYPTMQLRVYFKHIPITLPGDMVKISKGGRHEIDNPCGFVIYQDRLKPGCIPDKAVKFQLHPVRTTPDPNKPAWVPPVIAFKDAEIINEICKDMMGGLYVEYDNGCLYATRYSISHVFFWANDHNKPQTETKKLERKQRTLVFDYSAYATKVLSLAGKRDAILNERLPVVVFTFGFPWTAFSSRSPLEDTFVHAEVTPVAAVKWLWGLSNGQNCSITKGNIKCEDVLKSHVPPSF